MDLMAGIAAATQALGIAKALRAVEKSYDQATYKAQMTDLVDALTDAKLALAQAREDMAEKNAEIERLKRSFEKAASLVKGDGDYNFLTAEDGSPIGYPVCPKCEQVDGRVIQLKEAGNFLAARCPACDKTFTPVTCYLPGGDTKETKFNRETEAAIRSHAEDSRYF